MADISVQQILARYLGGESIQSIADQYDVSVQAVYSKLIDHAPDQWKMHQSACALDVLEKTEGQLWSAQDMVEVSRARELGSLARWKLERLLPSIYGEQKASVGVAIQVNVGISRE